MDRRAARGYPRLDNSTFTPLGYKLPKWNMRCCYASSCRASFWQWKGPGQIGQYGNGRSGRPGWTEHKLFQHFVFILRAIGTSSWDILVNIDWLGCRTGFCTVRFQLITKYLLSLSSFMKLLKSKFSHIQIISWFTLITTKGAADQNTTLLLISL